MNNNQPTQTPQQTSLPPGQGQSQPAQPDVTQHPQQSHFQPPPAPAYNPQWTIPHLSQPPSPEQSTSFYTNYGYGPLWHGQHQHHWQQHQYHISPLVAQPLPQLVSQPNYESYQPTAGYLRHYVPQPVATPQPQLAYHPHLLPQQEQPRWHPTPQDLRPAKRQRVDGPNSHRQVQQRALPPPQPQCPPPPPPVHNTGVYPSQSERSGSGNEDGWLNNVQPSANKGGQGGHGRGATMSGYRGEIANRGTDGDSDGEGRSGGGASIQTEGRNTIPASAEPAAALVATQLHGAHSFSISGNTRFTSIGMNTVNNYGGTHGLENLKEYVSFAALHGSAEQDPDRCCHPGTRKTVLKQLRDWLDNPNATDRIIWLYGPAGAGKSAIAQTFADEHKKRGVVATFFFHRLDPNRNDGNRLFPTIAWQLAFSIPPTKDFLVHVLDETPHLPTQAVEPQFEQLVAYSFQPTNNIASQLPQPAPVVIIDGADECSDEKLQQRFLAVIGNATQNHRIPLRFLIVSRPEALIEETLNKFKDFTVSIDLAKLDDSNRDIHKYLEDKFSEIASNRGLDLTWPGQEIIEEIVSKSSGNFIFASVVIRFINDEDYDPEFLLNIVRNLTPRGKMEPFALLDELFFEILKRQRDQDFLKTFLALLVGRSSIKQSHLHEDDATLMNVSEKDLPIRLRRMRSLLKFEPFIDVYHKFFFDFLQDPSRSGQYHISREGGLKRYLELIVDSVVRHVHMAIERPHCHGTCRSSPIFKSIVMSQPPKLVLSVEDWQEAIKPLLDLQDKLLKTSMPQSCRITQVMRDLLLHLVILQGISHPIAAAQASESNMKENVPEGTPTLVTGTQQNILDEDLDSCLSVLLSCLQKMDLVIVVDQAIFGHMFSLLAFGYAETVTRIRTVSDAQKLIDLVDLLTNDDSFISQYGRDTACKAARLASEIFSRVPLLPQSLFLNKPCNYIQRPVSDVFEWDCQSAFISRILDHDYIVPVLGIYGGSDRLRLASGSEDEQSESVHEWLERSSPQLVTRIRVILEIARTIRYIHSMDIALSSICIQSERFFLDSSLRARFEFIGLFAWWRKEASVYGHERSDIISNSTYESNIFAFATLFHSVCFTGRKKIISNRLLEDARQLIDRCCAKDPMSRPTMDDVVKEMETWNLT